MWLTNLFGRAKNINSDLATELQKKVRLRLCNVCPEKRNDFIFLYFFKKKGVSQCSICKCALLDKILWNDEKCPLEKW
jgi:hypothetical protein